MEKINLLQTKLREWAWINAPASYEHKPEEAVLQLKMDAKTDYWQKTHYNNYCADNGHFFNRIVKSDFQLSCSLSLAPQQEYDQAGLMVRIGTSDWIKVSLEFRKGGPGHLGSVVTQSGWSDWAYQDWPAGCGVLGFRIQRRQGDFILEYRAEGEDWHILRICHLAADTGDAPLRAGLYAAAPQQSGGGVVFTDLSLLFTT